MRSCLSWSESAQQLRGHRQSGRHVACAREWHACAREWHACAAAVPQRQSAMHVILQRRFECRSLPLYLSISLSLLTSGKSSHVLRLGGMVACLRGWRLGLVACMQASESVAPWTTCVVEGCCYAVMLPPSTTQPPYARRHAAGLALGEAAHSGDEKIMTHVTISGAYNNSKLVTKL